MSTYAPQSWLDWRTYMHEQTGLPPKELGITGDESHDGGYHHGWSQRRIVNGVLKDYSWSESPRDWNHKTNAARAGDIGMFPQLRELSMWLVGQCEANRLDPSVNPDCADIRSIIYSPDGVVVLRWDRLGLHTGGDPSHLTHTHVSEFADSENNDKIGPFRRFFEEEKGDQDMFLAGIRGTVAIWLNTGGGTWLPMPDEEALNQCKAKFGEVIWVPAGTWLPPKAPVPPTPGSGATPAQVDGIMRGALKDFGQGAVSGVS